MKQINFKTGHSLLETMVALVIFMIVMMGTISMLLATMNGNQKAQEMTSAYYLTQDLIEEINFEIQRTPNLADTLVTNGLITETRGRYTLEYSMFALPDPTINRHARNFEVTARWSTGTNDPRELTTHTIIYIP